MVSRKKFEVWLKSEFKNKLKIMKYKSRSLKGKFYYYLKLGTLANPYYVTIDLTEGDKPYISMTSGIGENKIKEQFSMIGFIEEYKKLKQFKLI